MRTVVKVILVLTVAFIVVFVFLWIRNTPATSTDLNEVKDRNSVDHHEGGTIEVSPSFFLTSETQPSMPVGKRKRNRVDHYRGKTRWVGAADPSWPNRGCRGIITIDRAFNQYDEFLFLIQVRGSWCWRNGHVKTFSFTRSAQRGDQWWNYFGSQPLWRRPVRGVHSDHVYNRQNAVWQVVWFGQVVKDEETWVSQTLRGNGSVAWDYKDHLHI